MGYRNPLFAYVHAARDAGSGALSLDVGSLVTAGTLPRLIDLLAEGSKLCQITAGGGGNDEVNVDLDLGAGGLPTVNRLVIPAGHNLAAATVTVQQDDVDTFATPTQLGQAVAPGAGVIDLALSPAVSQRYLRLRLTATPTTVDLGELYFTNRFELTEGIDPLDYRDDTLTKTRIDELGSGVEFTTELAIPRRLISMGWERITAANRQIIEDLVAAVGGARDPFWIWGADDTQPARWCRLVDDPEGQQGAPNPAGQGLQYDYQVRARERIG